MVTCHIRKMRGGKLFYFGTSVQMLTSLSGSDMGHDVTDPHLIQFLCQCHYTNSIMYHLHLAFIATAIPGLISVT